MSAALAGLSIYVVARPVTLAYFSGKALAVMAPIVILIGVRALIAAERWAGPSVLGKRVVWAGAVALFVVMAGYSSALVLRAAHVRPQDLGPDVADFRPLTRGEPTLYLGRDNFVGWELRGSQLSGFQNYTPLGAHLGERASKSEGDRPAVDVDSLDPGRSTPFAISWRRAPRMPRYRHRTSERSAGRGGMCCGSGAARPPS